MVVRCTGACLDLARSQRSRLVLAPEAPRVLAPCDLSQCASMRYQHGCNVYGVQKVVYYMLMYDLTILALQAIY
jgi:hypothetical protein